MGGGFPIDLLLFGMIAAFLILRLRGILGKRTGYERPPQQGVGERAGAAVMAPGLARTAAGESRAADVSARAVPDPVSALGITLSQMAVVDQEFDAGRFLGGAEAAFRMIVGGFAEGDRVKLRPLLADDTYRSFEAAISAREAAGETQRSEVRSVEKAAIEDASLEGTLARLTVRFVSDQVSETLGRDGRPVAGADAVAELTDIWTFERDLSQRDPAWRLAAARSG